MAQPPGHGPPVAQLPRQHLLLLPGPLGAGEVTLQLGQNGGAGEGQGGAPAVAQAPEALQALLGVAGGGGRLAAFGAQLTAPGEGQGGPPRLAGTGEAVQGLPPPGLQALPVGLELLHHGAVQEGPGQGQGVPGGPRQGLRLLRQAPVVGPGGPGPEGEVGRHAQGPGADGGRDLRLGNARLDGQQGLQAGAALRRGGRGGTRTSPGKWPGAARPAPHPARWRTSPGRRAGYRGRAPGGRARPAAAPPG